MMSSYQDFLASKRIVACSTGIEIDQSSLHPSLFDFQKALVQWALRKGRCALFADCGLGKSFMQLSWADQICKYTHGDVLILAPLAVTQQTVTEGQKLNITVHPCRSQEDVRPGINIANYEMLSHFDCAHFVGIVLDESSILKSFMGKTKRELIEAFKNTPYRLACTATPSPNDVMELGNHSEFLGIMPSSEMLMRWFINDTMSNGHYRLKGHATKDFWEWVSSWAISMRRPSDLGFSDDGFILPELKIRHHYIQTDITKEVPDGQLFRAPTMSATTLHKEKRITASERAQCVAELVNNSTEAWICWCDTNYEADELIKLIPDAIEIRGSDSIVEKERKINAFSNSLARVIIGKPSMLGFGLNWQHCHNAAFVGVSYSMEAFYQAVRRIYRFGQKSQVNIHIISADTESNMVTTLERKLQAHLQMSEAMNSTMLSLREDVHLTAYDPQVEMVLPLWLVSKGA